jgi:serine/threonine protein phosphatase 1
MHRTFVIGDIHGCISAVDELLETVDFDFDNDKLILIGDLCDRGPDTWAVIELLRHIKNIIFILGNHDLCFKQYLSGNEAYLKDWGIDMGKETIASYERRDWKNIELHKEFLNKSVSYYIENNICFVHGSFDRYMPIATQSVEFLCRDRKMAYEVVNNYCSEGRTFFTADNFEKIFIGHTPTICWNEGEETSTEEPKLLLSIDKPIFYPIVKGGVYLIDTGCGKGGPLTIFDVYADKYYQSTKKHPEDVKLPKLKYKYK